MNIFQEVFLTLKIARWVGKFIGSKSYALLLNVHGTRITLSPRFADQPRSQNLLEYIFADQQLREVCANLFLQFKGKNTEETSNFHPPNIYPLIVDSENVRCQNFPGKKIMG